MAGDLSEDDIIKKREALQLRRQGVTLPLITEIVKISVSKLKKLFSAEKQLGENVVLTAKKNQLGRPGVLKDNHVIFIHQMVKLLEGFLTIGAIRAALKANFTELSNISSTTIGNCLRQKLRLSKTKV